MDNNLVSIIVLSYKNLEYIKETLDSIIMQNYNNIELIIGDDGTEQFNEDIYIKYIEEGNKGNIKNILVYKNTSNLGTVKNANKAINLSSGKYIKFIAADDAFYTEEVILNMVEHMEKNKSIILATPVLTCDENMNERFDSKQSLKWLKSNLSFRNKPKEFFKKMAKTCSVYAPGIMFKKELFEKYGLFDEEYILVEDWPMWLKLLRQGVIFDYLDMISVKYRVGIGVSTSDKLNPIFSNDVRKCIEKEILPYRKELGYWTYKNIKYPYIRNYKFKGYSLLEKLLFIFINIDLISINQIKKIKLKKE